MRRRAGLGLALAALAAGTCAPAGDGPAVRDGAARIEVVVRRGGFFSTLDDSLPGDTVRFTFRVGERFGAVSECCEDRPPFRLVGLLPGRGALVRHEEPVQFRRLDARGWRLGPAGPETVLVTSEVARFVTLVPEDSCQYAMRVVPTRDFRAARGLPARPWRERAPEALPRLGETGGYDTPPRPLRRPVAGYPPRAELAGVEGAVWCAALVDARGTVGQARLLRGDSLLADSALASVRRWRFAPARRGGEPVAAWAIVAVRFRWPDRAREDDARGEPWPVIEVAR